ncbi:MAG TPA: transglycosylase SLT domain-containing protein [Bryobacteraceae bacterium]|nr:transglycosylase SLT domain-containing protein [Bryobacteraceae bacterium]
MGGQTSKSVRRRAKPAAHPALAKAAPIPRISDSTLAALKAGITAQAAKQPGEAIRDLRAVRERLPNLSDYVAYSLAAAEFDLGDFNAALEDIAPVWTNNPSSPFAGEAALVAGRAYRELGKPAESVRVLREYYSQLPQPAGDALLASCYRAASDLASSAVYYQRVYYQYPLSGDAEQAASALADLKNALGELYPPPTAGAMFQRAEKLSQAGEYRRARAEYEAMLGNAAGGDREVARVRLGVLDFLAYQTDSAYRYLTGLDLSTAEADAERLYYVLECARRMDRDDLLFDCIKRLERYPHSLWRLKALYSAGNRFLLDNRSSEYVPLYRACYESFQEQPQADYCHWKVTWNAYIKRRPEAVEMLREHLEKFPGSERASSALYFLGRLSEASGALDAAKSYYSEITARFPNHYYSDLSDGRLEAPALFKSPESAAVRAFLNEVVWPVRRTARKFEPTPVTQARINRARMLMSAGLQDLAEAELRYGAHKEDQPHVLAIQLASMANRYDSPNRAMRLMKNLVPGYLSIPLEEAPPSFWRLLYPMPWRTLLERNARLNGLDPYLVAGLIRQESEFNPEAVSPAQAYGLTQLLPSTGRMLLKAGRRRFRPSILFQPEVNLRLGTRYLRSMYDNYSGRWEQTLASYNAGGSRVQNWSGWAEYREPAEFIETIPFSETRNYVFSVMRNASIYRKLYSDETGGMLAADRISPVVRTPVIRKAAATAAVSKKGSFKRNPVVSKTKKHRPRAAARHRARTRATAKAKR